MRPRIRTIKPEVAIDGELWDLGQATGLPIFQAFTVLWCHADREGRFEWRPRELKPMVLPYWDGDMSDVLDALHAGGFLGRYECDGRNYGYVVNFLKHQAPNSREPQSIIPDPNGDTCTHVKPRADMCVHAPRARPVPVPVPVPVTKGGGGGKPKRGSRFAPDDLVVSDDHRKLARELGVDLDAEIRKLKEHEFAKPKTDWNRVVFRWIRQAAEFSGGRGSARTPPPKQRPSPTRYVSDRTVRS